jgi:HTH-type transcriptional regulator/antitoxin HigA
MEGSVMKTLVRSRKSRRLRVSKDYLDLIRLFPLHPLRSRTEFKSAGKILDKLVGRDDLTRGQLDYVESLVYFVAAYEKASVLKGFEKLSPIDLLRALMDGNDMNTSDLGEILGGRGIASEVLNGKRDLSKAMIRKLADRFCVYADLFLS